jgi:hypothetical protein
VLKPRVTDRIPCQGFLNKKARTQARLAGAGEAKGFLLGFLNKKALNFSLKSSFYMYYLYS